MKKIFAVAIFLAAFLVSTGTWVFAQNTTPVSSGENDLVHNAGGYHFPAEFEPQEAVWIAWPNYNAFPSENDTALDKIPVVIDMVRALMAHVNVKLVVNSSVSLPQVQATLMSNGIPLTSRISFPIIPYLDIGTRDWGPIYVVNDKGDKKIVHFNFTYWGLPQYADPEEMDLGNQFALRVAEKQELPVVEANMISEGGDRSFNGKGTMMAIEYTELQRNPGMTLEQIEAKFKQLLGVKKVVWLKRGVLDDNEPNEASLPGPDGKNNSYAIGAEHVDEVAHFADAHTILLAWVTSEEAKKDPIAAMNRQRLLEDYDRLKAATDQDGQTLRIIFVPAAETMYYPLTPADDYYQWIQPMEFLDGSKFPPPGELVYELVPTSYMNIIVSNGVVVVPEYWKPGLPDVIKQKDAQVGAIMQAAFPGREIVRVNPFAYNVGSGGGMHCSFQQEPAGRK
jgi:agmatine deiminase